jgi:hypothetical protein
MRTLTAEIKFLTTVDWKKLADEKSNNALEKSLQYLFSTK